MQQRTKPTNIYIYIYIYIQNIKTYKDLQRLPSKTYTNLQTPTTTYRNLQEQSNTSKNLENPKSQNCLKSEKGSSRNNTNYGRCLSRPSRSGVFVRHIFKKCTRGRDKNKFRTLGGLSDHG